MQLIRGRWSKKYINCPEDKRDYDIMRRGFMRSHEQIASKYCEKYNPPELTSSMKKAISEYWAQFGIKIYDYDWHRMYYHATGIEDVRFVPDLVAGLVVYEYYNDKVFENTWRDKNMFDRLLPNVPLPKCFAKCIRGRKVCDNNYLSQNLTTDAFARMIWNKVKTANNIIIKNTRDTGFGKSVKKYYVSSEADVEKAIAEWESCSDYIIQECVRQHPVMESLNPTSSNMIRVCSWRHGNQVEIMFAAARVGIENSVTDVSFVNGEERVNIVGISQDGFFSDKMIDQDGQFVKNIPSGLVVPAWDKIIEIIKQNHLLIDNFDFIGWDFTIDENGNPICFEWNISWPGTVLYQYANGPLYGNMTEKVFEFLKDDKNKYNFIPYYMQIK